ncbi:hypothetical protein BDP55DRAFT_567340, partial [Colletotrichum godetiae]
ITYNANNFTLVFTGYFRPDQTGTFTFCYAPDADNRDVLYLGSTSAFPCGQPSNAATPRGATPLAQYWFAASGNTGCVSTNLVAGFFYPIRSVFGNWGTPSSLSLVYTGPGRTTNSSDISGLGYAESC